VNDLSLSEWRPRPQVVLPEHVVERPAYDVVDVHNHVGRWLSESADWLASDRAGLESLLDAAHVETLVNLDGRWGDELDANVARYDRASPGRYVTFCHVEWSRLAESGSAADRAVVEALAGQLAESARAGARGVKVWKDLGLRVRDATGALVLPDDDRVVGVLRAAGDLGLPVLIHTADPVAFFEPLDECNERIEELAAMPDW
jgi:hypothetical protein